jgi:hypothetical protein
MRTTVASHVDLDGRESHPAFGELVLGLAGCGRESAERNAVAASSRATPRTECMIG